MSKQYQNEAAWASEPVVPESVSVAIEQVTADVREGLLAMAVGTGLQVMAAMMEADVTAACGPRGKHNPDRAAVRHGREQGSVTLGGRRVGVSRPRMRAADGSAELPVPSYETFTSIEVLGRMAMERMLAGLSTRHYTVGLEPVGDQVEQAATSTSRSAVSRKFVQATETALAELMAADLSTLDLVAFMVDGVHFGEHTCVVALGIGTDGTKYPLALVEGSTENATLARELIVGLRERCGGRSSMSSTTRSSLAASSTRSATYKTSYRRSSPRWWASGCGLPSAESALAAQAKLEALAGEIDRTHPGPHAAFNERHRVHDQHLS